MQALKIGIDVDSYDALAKLEALTEAAQRAEAALKAFSEAYKAVGNVPVALNVVQRIKYPDQRSG